MKRYCILLICILIFKNTYSQLNLVPNPSFEDTLYCPFGLTQIDAAIGWSSYRNSPDYYNGCNITNSVTVPNSNFGYQFANSGFAYSGVATYYKFNSPSGNNYREYLGAMLSVPLQVGTKYYFSFYAVLAERNTGFSSNNLGLRFFVNSYSLSNPAPLDNFSHLKFDSLLIDSINWQRISGSFVADSIYQYVSIGNFYNYLNTDTIIVTPFATAAYFFIDDICVTTDSLYNETWTGLNNIEQKEVNVWPNPVQDYVQFKSEKIIQEIIISDSRGSVLDRQTLNSRDEKIDLSGLANGIYFVTFRSKEGFTHRKLVKN